MASYYLDVETTGLSPANSEIITIQYQKLDFNTKEAVGPLIILKSWESSEKDILTQFKGFLGSPEDKWRFIGHGYNLHFENDFLRERCIANGLKPIKLFDRPTVDLHPVGIMMNAGQFKGSGLDKISGKEGNGLAIIGLNESKQYSAIENYIKQEADAYIKLLVFLCKKMPEVLAEFQISLI